MAVLFKDNVKQNFSKFNIRFSFGLRPPSICHAN